MEDPAVFFTVNIFILLLAFAMSNKSAGVVVLTPPKSYEIASYCKDIDLFIK